MLESYVSSSHCVGSLSYKLSNGRDVALLGFGRGKGGRNKGAGLQRGVEPCWGGRVACKQKRN